MFTIRLCGRSYCRCQRAPHAALPHGHPIGGRGLRRSELSMNRVVSLKQIARKFVITSGVCTLGLLAAACGSSAPLEHRRLRLIRRCPRRSPRRPSRSDFAAMATLKPLAARGQGRRSAVHPARHRHLGPLHRVRRAVPDQGLQGRRALAPPSSRCRTPRAATPPSRPRPQAAITNGRQRAGHRPARLRCRRRRSRRTPPRTGVKVIDYDRLTLGGSRKYYVSFNNVQVGKLIGKGLVELRQRPGTWRSRRSWSWTATRPTTTPRCSPRATTRVLNPLLQLAAPTPRSASRPAPGTRRPR